MKLTIKKSQILFSVLIASIFFLGSCKKDKLITKEEKQFYQVNHKVETTEYVDAGWQLTLKPNGTADILPGGDIVEAGTYKIKGKKLTVKAGSSTFEFDIINKSDIKEKKHGILLRWVKQ